MNRNFFLRTLFVAPLLAFVPILKPETKEQYHIRLIKEMASKNKSESRLAQEKFAKFIGAEIRRVLEESRRVGFIYS